MALSKLHRLTLIISFLFLTQYANLGVSRADSQWTAQSSLDVKRLSDLTIAPDSQQILYGVKTVDLEGDVYTTRYVVSDLDGTNTQTLIPTSPHVSSPQWSPDGRWIAYLSSESGHNSIWMVGSDGGEGRQITQQKQDILSFQWAPSGKALAFVMPDPDFEAPPVEDPDVFNRNRLWLLSLDSEMRGGEPVNLTAGADFTVSDWGGSWAYDWSPDSSRIAFAYQDDPGLDAWTRAQLADAEVATGKVTKLVIGNDHWAYFPKYAPDGKWLAFINAPGAFKWSFLWDIKVVPAGGGEAIEIAESDRRLPLLWQWAPDSQSLYYIENDRSTYSFYAMPIDGRLPVKVFGSPQDLSKPGLNGYLVSSYIDVADSGDRLVFVGQTYDQPPEVYLSDLDRFAPKKVSSVNEAFAALPLPRTELVQWHSQDNTEVEGILTYPVGYRPGSTYPLVVQIHGGPNGVDFNEYLPLVKFFATAVYPEKGFFVLRVNYRGSLGYGITFREDLIGEFGVLDYQDIISGVDHVIDLGLVDRDQLFLVGQSNGGTMTSWIITQTNRFKAACPIAGETDYISLEGTNEYFQTSWYLGGSFVDNLQIFLDRSPIFHVKGVRTPTLIQGGLLDENVPFSQLKEFHRALKRAGVDAQLVGYPGSDHDYYPPKLYLRLLQSCLDWTVKHRGQQIPQ